METREFWGRDMGEALQAVRASLGEDVLILETLSVPAENSKDGGERVKIIAVQEKPAQGGTPTPPLLREKGTLSAMREEPKRGGTLPASSQEKRTVMLTRKEMEAEEVGAVSRQLADLKAMLCWLVPGMKNSGVVAELATQGVPPDLMVRLLQEAEAAEGTDEREKLRRTLTRLLPTGGDVEVSSGQRVCLALLGPPGTGKTSTLVKLTVRLTRGGPRRVGWVSLDNRRVTGAEELMAYAGILGVPCEVAEGQDGLTQALDRLSTCELVLVDTAGMSARDREGIKELAGLLHDIPHLRRTLVLSATTNGHDMKVWSDRYGRVGFDSLLFTMVDECGHFGPLVSTALTCGQPLSYLATGQRVTHDLEVARPETLARLLLPE